MRSLAIVGANGFVGSAFVRQSTSRYQVTEITRDNYASYRGHSFDVVVDASGNSKKFISDEDPERDFDLTVRHRLKTVRDFVAPVHLHVSSVDVYVDLASPETTREETPIDRSRQSRYGFHKLLAEDVVRHYANEWLIVRLAGMVGPGLRKNPVFDILHGKQLRLHPDSCYQYMRTDEAARVALWLLETGARGLAVNVCGRGVMSLREIASRCGVAPRLGDGSPPTRIVHASTALIEKQTAVESTEQAITTFLGSLPR